MPVAINNTDPISRLYMINYPNCSFVETLIWEYFTIHSASSSEVVYDSSSRKVSELHDNSFSQVNAYRSNNKHKPILSKNQKKINK